MKVIKESGDALEKAVFLLKKGDVVICPTDTVYGFLADASNKKAVDKIFKIKKRLRSKPLSLFVKDVKMAQGLAHINKSQASMLNKYWPGKYTFVLPKKQDLKIYGVAEDTIALRIPDHEFLNKLLKKIDIPLAQTSVNISGRSIIDTVSNIVNQFGKKQILIIDGGDLKNAKASKIIDATKDAINIIRP